MAELTLLNENQAIDAEGWLYDLEDDRWVPHFDWADFEAKVFVGPDPKPSEKKKPKKGKSGKG